MMLEEDNGEKTAPDILEGPESEPFESANLEPQPEPSVVPDRPPTSAGLDRAALLFLFVNLALLLFLASLLLRVRKPTPPSHVGGARRIQAPSAAARLIQQGPEALPPSEDIYETAEEAPPSPSPATNAEAETEIDALLQSEAETPRVYSTMDGPRKPEVGIDFKDRDRIYVLSGNKQPVEKYKSYTPDLIEAVISCDPKSVAAMLGDGAEVNTVDDSGDSALIWSVKRRCVPVTKLLLAKGANVNAISRNGFTPYVWARLYRSTEIQALLLKAGANPKAGKYWWRFEEDAELEWVSKALENACRNKDCLSESRKKK